MTKKSGMIIDLELERKKRGLIPHDPIYQIKVNKMDKMELLEEMVRFNDSRSKGEKMSLSLMIQGRILFKALELMAQTEELRILAGSYRKHLEHELEEKLNEIRSLFFPRPPQY
ncbi:MAG: hypothetical protein KGP28_11515 [Bdellovibrionales bacterium]|nr:hypothetical protein [Bdellovibrionales bacterium]